MAHPREIYDLLIERAAADETVEEVVIGLTWTMCRARSTGLSMSPAVPTRTLSWPGTLAGQTLRSLAPWLRSWDPYEATVGMAAVNAAVNADSALCESALPIAAEGVPGNLVLFEYFAPLLAGKRVVVIGRYPGLERFGADFELHVIELRPGPGDLPAPASEYLLPEADWVFLTASAIPNKTFPRLAELARETRLVLMGPTVPWLPELSAFGVDFVAGVQVTDPPALRRTLAEGGGTRIFEGPVQYRLAALSGAAREALEAIPPR